MQFGIGILGKGWTFEAHLERVRANTSPPRANFPFHAEGYASKIAAETILAETPTAPDLSDEAILALCARCALPVRPSEVDQVRGAFIRLFGQQSFDMVVVS